MDGERMWVRRVRVSVEVSIQMASKEAALCKLRRVRDYKEESICYIKTELWKTWTS
jgi:hypothetical protein